MPAHTNCMASTFLHTIQISFVPYSGFNQATGGHRQYVYICVSLLSVRIAYTNILNLLVRLIWTHKWLRSTINHPPNPPVRVDGSSVWFHTLWSSMWLALGYTKQPCSFSSLYAYLEKEEQQKTKPCVWTSLSFFFLKISFSSHELSVHICVFPLLSSVVLFLTSSDKTNPPV